MIEYVIQKFITTIRSKPHAYASLLGCINNSETVDENGFSKSQLDNLYSYYSQFEDTPDPIECIIETYKRNQNQTKTRLNVIQVWFFFKKLLEKIAFLTFPACFYIPIIFSNMNYNCSDLLDLRNIQEKVKKAFCYQKLFEQIVLVISKILQILGLQPPISNVSFSITRTILVTKYNFFTYPVYISCPNIIFFGIFQALLSQGIISLAQYMSMMYLKSVLTTHSKNSHEVCIIYKKTAIKLLI